MEFKPLSSDQIIRRYRRNLPHWRAAGATYFITFRTADSLPSSRLPQIEEQRRLWLQFHPPPWSAAEYAEFQRFRFRTLDRWLDQGLGACALRDPRLAREVEETLRFYDGRRYVLDEFSVMPNHVHALVLPIEAWEIETILQSWKSFSAHSVNELLDRSGTFWLDETYDHIVRSVEELERTRAYIRNNPKSARLSAGTYRVSCGSGIET